MRRTRRRGRRRAQRRQSLRGPGPRRAALGFGWPIPPRNILNMTENDVWYGAERCLTPGGAHGPCSVSRSDLRRVLVARPQCSKCYPGSR